MKWDTISSNFEKSIRLLYKVAKEQGIDLNAISTDVIQWYLFFIDAKLQRALHGKMDGEDWATQNDYPKDSDGSAKIACIAIERSMKAWTRLYNLLPSKEDTILHSLTLLEQLSRKTKEEFPDAMQFKRPGFDD